MKRHTEIEIYTSPLYYEGNYDEIIFQFKTGCKNRCSWKMN